MTTKHPKLQKLQLIFFRACNVCAIAGLGTSVVLLLLKSFNCNSLCTGDVVVPACLVAGCLSLGAFWTFTHQIDKIKNDF